MLLVVMKNIVQTRQKVLPFSAGNGLIPPRCERQCGNCEYVDIDDVLVVSLSERKYRSLPGPRDETGSSQKCDYSFVPFCFMTDISGQ